MHDKESHFFAFSNIYNKLRICFPLACIKKISVANCKKTGKGLPFRRKKGAGEGTGNIFIFFYFLFHYTVQTRCLSLEKENNLFPIYKTRVIQMKCY